MDILFPSALQMNNVNIFKMFKCFSASSKQSYHYKSFLTDLIISEMFKLYILLLLSYMAFACKQCGNSISNGRKRREVTESDEVQLHYDLPCPEDLTQSTCTSGQGETIIKR